LGRSNLCGFKSSAAQIAAAHMTPAKVNGATIRTGTFSEVTWVIRASVACENRSLLHGQPITPVGEEKVKNRFHILFPHKCYLLHKKNSGSWKRTETIHPCFK
jgi:hypothetical protein